MLTFVFEKPIQCSFNCSSSRSVLFFGHKFPVEHDYFSSVNWDIKVRSTFQCCYHMELVCAEGVVSVSPPSIQITCGASVVLSICELVSCETTSVQNLKCLHGDTHNASCFLHLEFLISLRFPELFLFCVHRNDCVFALQVLWVNWCKSYIVWQVLSLNAWMCKEKASCSTGCW